MGAIDGRRAILAALFVAFALNRAPAAAPPTSVPLPRRAVGRIGSDRFYHGPGVWCAVLSPDSRRIASVAYFPSYFRYVSQAQRDAQSRTIVLWDAATGERLRELLA